MSYPRYVSKVVCCLLVMLGAATALAQDAPISDKAKQHFEAGISFADDPDGPKWEEACREFHAAYADSPNYQFLNNIGLCSLNLERDSDAIEAYEGFLVKATDRDIPPKKRKRVERDIQMLKMGLVRVSITAVPENTSLVDERIPAKGSPVINRYSVIRGRASLGIHPGHHRLTATAEGYKPTTWEFDAANAATLEREFRLEPEPSTTAGANGQRKPDGIGAVANGSVGARKSSNEPPKGLATSDVVAPTPTSRTPTMVYIGAGATGLFVVGATILGFEAIAKNDDLKDKNDGKHVAEAESLQKDAKLFALLSDVGTGAAILCAVGTTYLYLTSRRGAIEAPAPKTAALRIAPVVNHASASMNIVGEF